MNFEHSEELKHIAESAKDFAEKYILPHRMEWDENQTFPVELFKKAGEMGYGIIARMPLQFGLLTGKFDKNTRFDKSDHRSFRLTPSILEASLDALEPAWPVAEKYGISKTELAMSFITSFPEVSTVIPGIKTAEQADRNTSGLMQLDRADHEFLQQLFDDNFQSLLEMMLQAG